MADEPITDDTPIQQLREGYDRQKARAEEGDQAKRELAFYKAGIDPENNVIARLFVTAYDGDLTTDAIKAAAEEVPGLLTPANAPAPPADPGEQLLQQQQGGTPVNHQALAGGDNPPPNPAEAPKVDLLDQGWTDFKQELQNGRTVEDASAALIGRILEGARDGDPRFVFDEQAHRQAAAEARGL